MYIYMSVYIYMYVCIYHCKMDYGKLLKITMY